MSIRALFTNGPAKGRALTLNRTCVLLRVFIDSGGDVDALDSPEDTAKPTETITAYVLTRKPSVCFVDYVKNGRRGGSSGSLGSYEVLTEQPDDATMRDNTAWHDWCHANWDRLGPEWAKVKGSVAP